MQDAGQQNLQMHQEMAAEAQMPQCCGLESPVESGRVLARGTRRFPLFLPRITIPAVGPSWETPALEP